jgi:hypothetical protein
MKGNRAVITAVVIVLLAIVGWWAFKRSGSAGAIDLLDTFDQAEKRPASPEFTVIEATLAGETKKAVAVPGGAGTRLIWKNVRIPDDGWLRVSVGLKPDAWEKEGDGVKFLVLVSDHKASDELFSQHVNPFGNPADRKWIPVMVDLSAYSGEDVDLIFNTYASPPGGESDVRNDLPLWGNPEIVIR